MNIDIFTDAGMIEGHPSKVGGVYCYRIVDRDTNKVLHKGAGFRLVEDIRWASSQGTQYGQMSSNYIESYAIIVAVRVFADRYLQPESTSKINLRILSDSENAIKWVASPRRFRSTTAFDYEYNSVELYLDLMHLGSMCEIHLTDRRVSYINVMLSGHPSIDDIGKGISKATGRPVSLHNKHCDEVCKAISVACQKRFIEEGLVKYEDNNTKQHIVSDNRKKLIEKGLELYGSLLKKRSERSTKRRQRAAK